MNGQVIHLPCPLRRLICQYSFLKCASVWPVCMAIVVFSPLCACQAFEETAATHAPQDALFIISLRRRKKARGIPPKRDDSDPKGKSPQTHHK